MSPRNGTVVPGRRTSPVGGLRDQNPSAFDVDVIAVCPSYTAVDRWRPSFLGRHHSYIYLERSPTPCHVRTISASFLQSPEDASLPAFLPMTFVVPACEVTLSLLDTLIVLVTYLITLYNDLLDILCDDDDVPALRQPLLRTVFLHFTPSFIYIIYCSLDERLAE